MSKWILLVAVLCIGTGTLKSEAQEPTFMEAATHPGAGQSYGRFVWLSHPLRGGSQTSTLDLKSAYGITSRLALLPNASFDEDGITAASFRIKQRIFQLDTGPIDTWRMSVQAGGEWFDDRDPSVRAGIVSTTIRGRHGVNAQFDWHDSDIGERRFQVNASHLYRIAPAQFSAATQGAWYTMLESLNYANRDADIDSDIGLGLLYEARRWASEISFRLTDVDNGVSIRQTRIGAGFRALF